MATAGGDDNEWQKLSPDQKVQHKVEREREEFRCQWSESIDYFRHGKLG